MWRHLFLVPVYLLATSLPLVTSVGANLEYEYALMAAYLGLLLIPMAALWLPTRYIPLASAEFGSRPQVKIPFEVFWIFAIGPALALVPALYGFLIGRCPCSKTGFVFWMAILWYPSWILSHAAYHLLLRGRSQNVSRLLLAASFAFVVVLAAAIDGIELWTNPQKRLMSFIFGFLHGPIYDDYIAFDGGLLLARSSHLLLASALLFIAWMRRRAAVLTALGLFLTGWAITGAFAARFPSTYTDKQSLDKLLAGRLKGDGFTLYYRPAASPSDGNLEGASRGRRYGPPSMAIQRLYRDSWFHVQELKSILQEQDLPHVHIYVYPDDDKKKLWFGGGSTDVADVYTPSIHISQGSWPHPTLRHELVHALLSDIGFHGIGFHPNMAFTEGLAVALAPSAQTLSPDEGAASLIRSKRLPDVTSLFSPKFWQVSGSRAYTVAGSLLAWLIKTKGIDGVKRLYSGEPWDEAFKESRTKTIADWSAAIQANYDDEKNAIFTEALYRYPGVLGDDCPHSKADLQRSRSESPFVRIRQPIDWDPDTDYLPWLLTFDANDKQTRLHLWRQKIDAVATDRFVAQGRLETWRATLSRARSIPSVVLEDVEIGIIESDLARLMGDLDASIAILNQLLEESHTRYFGESLRRELEARLKIETLVGGDKALEWRRLLAGWRRSLPETVGLEAPWLLTYLKLRHDREQASTPQAVNYLTSLLDLAPDPTVSTSFHFEWYKTLGHRLMRTGAFKEAQAAYQRAAQVASRGSSEVFAQHARRAAFYDKKGSLVPDRQRKRQAASIQ